MPNTTDKIRNKIREKFRDAEKNQLSFIDIRSGTLYDELENVLNLPPSPHHRMPICCNAMLSLQTDGDIVLEHPPSYQGTNLVIRYMIPR